MALNTHATEEEADAEVERVWREKWLPIVGRPDGSIDMEQVKRELHDLDMLIDHCTKAYGWMTDDRVTNYCTEFHVVQAIAEDRRTAEIEEAIADAKDVD